MRNMLIYAVGTVAIITSVFIWLNNPLELNQPKRTSNVMQLDASGSVCNTVFLYMAGSSTHDMFVTAVNSVHGSVNDETMAKDNVVGFASILVPGRCTADVVNSAIAQLKKMPGVVDAGPDFFPSVTNL
jgi:hypothetical protein